MESIYKSRVVDDAGILGSAFRHGTNTAPSFDRWRTIFAVPSKTKKVDEKRNARREALGAMARTRVPPTYLEKVVQVKIPNPHDIPQAEQIHILPDNKGVLHT